MYIGLISLVLVMLTMCSPRLIAAFGINFAQLSIATCLSKLSNDYQPQKIRECLGLSHSAKLLKPIALLNPRDVRLLWSLSQAYFLAGRYDQAALTLDLSIDSALPLVRTREQQFEYTAIHALVSKRHRRWFEAVDWFRRAMSLEPDRFSPEFDLAYREAILDFLQERVARGPSDVVARYLLAKHLAQNGRLEEAVPHAQFVIEHSGSPELRPIEVGQAHFLLGQHLAQQGKSRLARYDYQAAVLYNFPASEGVRALLGYSDVTSQDALKNMIAGLHPIFDVNQPVGDEWILEGFTLSERDLEFGGPFRIWLFWKPLMAVVIHNPSWCSIDDRWVQEAWVTNLAPNAGFEWGTGCEEPFPFGYPAGIYPEESLAQHQVTWDRRERLETRVAIIDNSLAPSRRGSLASFVITVNPDAYYIQGGWIKSESGTGLLGRRWILPMSTLDYDSTYDYVIVSVKDSIWQYYVGVTRPLLSADRCQLWLLNYASTGKVYFDNLLFVEIRDPCAQAGVKCNGKH